MLLLHTIVLWIIDNSNESKDIKKYIESLIKEKNSVSDKYLKNAWYMQEGGDILVKYGTDAKLSSRFRENNDEKEDTDIHPNELCIMINDDYDSIYNYVKEIGFNVKYVKNGGNKEAGYLFSNYIATDDNFYSNIKNNRIKVLSPEWVEKIKILREYYKKNKEHDKRYVGIPSKQILGYWEIPKVPGKNMGSGKWCLYFNKYIEDENRLTELDRMYSILVKNYEKITTRAF